MAEQPRTVRDALVDVIGARRMTITAAALELGIGQSRLSRWTLGDSLPDPSAYDALIAFLDVTREDFALLMLDSQVEYATRRKSSTERWRAFDDRHGQG